MNEDISGANTTSKEILLGIKENCVLLVLAKGCAKRMRGTKVVACRVSESHKTMREKAQIVDNLI